MLPLLLLPLFSLFRLPVLYRLLLLLLREETETIDGVGVDSIDAVNIGLLALDQAFASFGGDDGHPVLSPPLGTKGEAKEFIMVVSISQWQEINLFDLLRTKFGLS